MRRRIEITLSALLILSGTLPASADDTALGSFSAPAWRNAPYHDPQHWSRESLLAGLPRREQMQRQDRATIIARLGVPGNSYGLYTPGMGLRGRLDIYRLSAKNDRVLRIDYDAKDRFRSDEVEIQSCGCPRCAQALPDESAMTAMDVLARTVLAGIGTFATAITKGRIERLLGHVGRSFAAIEQDGGQAWTDYGEIWRLTGAGDRFFIASGSVPARDRATLEDAELPIRDYAIVTVGPDCPSR